MKLVTKLSPQIEGHEILKTALLKVLVLLNIIQCKLVYRVIRKSLRDFRPLRYSSRDGHAEGEHCQQRERHSKFLSYLTGARYVHPRWRGRCQSCSTQVPATRVATRVAGTNHILDISYFEFFRSGRFFNNLTALKIFKLCPELWKRYWHFVLMLPTDT
jgi:hypothetical protein